MKIELIEKDDWYRISRQENEIVKGITSRINTPNILEFVISMLKDYAPQDYNNLYRQQIRYYKTIGEFDAISEIFEYIKEIYSLGSKDDFNDYKGAIPEKLLYEKIKLKYSDSDCLCERECHIIIDGWKSGKVDVAGWNCFIIIGDAYECKFWLGLSSNQITILEEIKEKSSEKIEPHIFTFTTEENYKRILRQDYPNCNIDIIDQEKIFKI